MKGRIIIFLMAAAAVFMLFPLPCGTAAKEPVTDSADISTGRIKVYYIYTEDAGNLLEDTWIQPEYQEYCREIGTQYRIPPYLLMAMIEEESSGDAQAVNSAGDSGLVQVNRKWHEKRMEKLGVTDLMDPYSNILVAVDYLSELLQENNYNMPLALMKYNMDHERAETLMEQGVYSAYAQKVITRMWEMRLLHRKEDAG